MDSFDAVRVSSIPCTHGVIIGLSEDVWVAPLRSYRPCPDA